MAINLDISENTERIPLSIQSNASLRAISSENGSPYYVGARAYVTQTSNGAVVTVIDKDGTTTATILNGTNGVDGADGQDGEDGVGIASVVLNADYTLTILMTDGTSATTASIRGERGEQGERGIQGERGEQGIQGIQGERGLQGDTGNGIASAVLNADYTLTLTFTDGTTYTTPSIRGLQGEQGVQGVQGERGLQGEQGVQGVKGDTGATGATGNGIANIAKTSTSGLVDTYTITYTNGATDTFQVKNGENGSGSVADVWVDGVSVLDGDTAKIDLSGKADASDIPTKVSDLTNDSGFITDYTETDPVFVASAAHGITSSNISTWNGKYTKPTGGIPKTDLATAVQTSLEKADTALQSYTETDPTVPSWAKQASKPTYTASEVDAVPITRTVNGKALSDDITLSASDVSALPANTSIGVTEVSANNVSSLPITISNANILENHVCVKAVLSNPPAQTSDWTVATSDGSAVISGTISGTTDITLYLELKK